MRSHNEIATYREGESRERGEVTLDEGAAALAVSPSTVLRIIKDGDLTATQLCKGAPWVIPVADLELGVVRQAADARRLRRPTSDVRESTAKRAGSSIRWKGEHHAAGSLAPVMSKLRRSASQSQAASLRNSARSSPRGL